MPVSDVADRLELVFNIFIASMATLYTINEALPNSSFLNRIDKLVMASVFTLFLICAETCVGSRMLCAPDDGPECTADEDVKRADLVFACVSMGIYALYNVHLFGVSLYKLSTTTANARPTWLPKHKVYTPISKVFAIDIWADTIMKKADPKSPKSKPAPLTRKLSMGWISGSLVRRDSYNSDTGLRRPTEAAGGSGAGSGSGSQRPRPSPIRSPAAAPRELPAIRGVGVGASPGGHIGNAAPAAAAAAGEVEGTGPQPARRATARVHPGTNDRDI